MRSIPFFLLGILFYGCVTDSGDKLPEPKAVSVNNIKAANVVGRSASFTVVCTVPEPCWRFVRSEITSSGNIVTATMIAQRTTKDPCLQVLVNIDAPATVTVASAGTYVFKFWRNDGSTVDTTLTIQ